MEIQKVKETGFCFGVRRAIRMLEKAAKDKGDIETLGALVHNEQVTRRLNEQGISIINSPEEISRRTVAISAHGVSPQVEEKLKQLKVEIIDTTCPSVKSVQLAAQRLMEAGFYVVVFGDAQHPEVKGILGWAQGRGQATTDIKTVISLDKMPRRLGVLSQTTQVPESFTSFVKDLVGAALTQGVEIHIIDTICEGVRNRQSQTLELARQADLMLVVGGRASANTRRLLELCSPHTETYLIVSPDEINPDWLKGKKKVGITSGTSTSEETIEEVIERLETLAADAS